jgi:hypothetical protein
MFAVIWELTSNINSAHYLLLALLSGVVGSIGRFVINNYTYLSIHHFKVWFAKTVAIGCH